jgi:hypothetical protein
LEIVEKQRQRVFLPGKCANEPAKDRIEAVLCFLRRELQKG